MEQVNHKRYVARRRARFKGYNGQQVNIPYGSILEAQGGFLMWKGEPLCVVTSQNAYDFFSQDDDGQGEARGRLVGSIMARLERRDNNYQARWNKVWSDALCQQYRRPEHEDWGLWGFKFYNAPICDLRHIAALVGAERE